MLSFHPEILTGSLRVRRHCVKQGIGGENKSCSSFKRQYLENGERDVQIKLAYYLWLIGKRIYAFD